MTNMKPIKRGDYFLLPVSPGCTAQKDRLMRMIEPHSWPFSSYWYATRVSATVRVLVNVARCKRMAPSWARNIIKGRKANG